MSLKETVEEFKQLDLGDSKNDSKIVDAIDFLLAMKNIFREKIKEDMRNKQTFKLRSSVIGYDGMQHNEVVIDLNALYFFLVRHRESPVTVVDGKVEYSDEWYSGAVASCSNVDFRKKEVFDQLEDPFQYVEIESTVTDFFTPYSELASFDQKLPKGITSGAQFLTALRSLPTTKQ